MSEQLVRISTYVKDKNILDLYKRKERGWG